MFSAEAVASGLIWAGMSFMAAFWPPGGRFISAGVKYITLNLQRIRKRTGKNNLNVDDNRSDTQDGIVVHGDQRGKCVPDSMNLVVFLNYWLCCDTCILSVCLIVMLMSQRTTGPHTPPPRTSPSARTKEGRIHLCKCPKNFLLSFSLSVRAGAAPSITGNWASSSPPSLARTL